MANVQQVKIVTTQVNLRATSLRSRLTDLVAVAKCGTEDEKREARSRFEQAVDCFLQVV